MTMKHNILTITLNPSVDVLYRLDNFKTGSVHRVPYVSKTAGGKGLNVTNVLNMLGVNVTAAGFLGGANGIYIKDILQKKMIHHDFTEVPINTRNCINIASDGIHTELLEESDAVPPDYTDTLIRQLSVYENLDFAVISGSLVKGIPDSIYAEIIKMFNEKDIKVILDVNARILETVLNEDVKIFMMKPNKEEADTLFNGEVSLPEQVENMIVSLGADGLLCYRKDSRKKVNVPKVNVKNTVGSGDASVAGFIYGYINGTMDDALISMAAAGTANALSDMTGTIEIKNYKALLQKVSVENI